MNVLYTLAQSYDTYTYSTTGTDVDTAAGTVVALFFAMMFFVFALLAYVIQAIFMGRIFKKAGLAAWPAWVPFYNTWKLLEIGGQQGFWAILALIPIVNIVAAVFLYIAMYHVGLKLGKSGAFVVLGIFLPIVWIIWLGADSSKWDEQASANAPNLATGPLPNSNKAA